MGILVPIEEDSGPLPLLVAAGSSSAQMVLSVTNRVRLRAAGSSQAQLALRLGPSGALALTAAAAGSSSAQMTLRLNGEANIALSGAAEGSSQAQMTLSVRAGLALTASGSSSAQMTLFVKPAEEFGFTVFVDVLSTAAQGALENIANIRRFRPRLLVSGVVVPVLRAEESARPDQLGIELSVVLARPDVAAVGLADSVDFEIGVWTGSAYEYVPRMTGARLSGRGARYANEEGLPADAVRLSFVDVLGDRWNRAPERNTLLYDPDEVERPEPSQLASLAVYDESARGGRIAPLVRAVPELSLLKALDAAFVEGCGFSRVVTNVEDFPVEQVAFTRSGGYDDAVRGYLSLYDVIPSVVGDDLWLVDTGAPLPAGLSPRAFPASMSLAIDDELPQREPVSAILVRLKSGGGDYSTEEEETLPPVESPAGGFGQPGFTLTSVERRVMKWRNYSAPETVVRQETVYEQTTVEDHEFKVISRETRRDTFDALGRHTGYTREVEGRLPDPEAGGARTLRPVAEETQLITYTPDPSDTRRDLQDRVETRKRGLILIDEGREYLGEPYRLPLDDAHRSGYIDPDAGQRTEFGPVSTELIELKVRGAQVTRERRVINHLTNAPDSSKVEVLPADNSVERADALTRWVLVRAEGATEDAGRRVPEFDGSNLPPGLALTLAKRRLQQLNNPPREVTVQATYVDPLMRRGADLRLYGRASEPLLDAIVRGYSIVFSSEGDEFEATMSIQAKELRQ